MKKAAFERLFSFIKPWSLFHDDLFHAHLRASGETEEVDTLSHVVDADLCVACGIAAGDLLSHAVEHLVAELGIAAVDKQGVVDRVGIDGKFSLVFADGIEEFNDDAIRH